MTNQPVILHSASLGAHVGALQSHDGSAVMLGPCRTLIKWRAGATLIDIAKHGIDKRDGAVSHQIDGPVVLLDVTLIAPLSDAAVKSIVRVSEDNLSLLSADEMDARRRLAVAE